MTIDHDAIAARVEYASDLIDPLVTLAADMERHAVEEWDESDFIIQVADTLRALISQNATYRERLEKAESALHDEVKRLRSDLRHVIDERDATFALMLARAEKAEDERDDAISTLDAWFDRRKLGHDAVDQAVLDCAKGYLRTSRVGGMPQEKSDAVLAVIEDMVRLSVFADLFIRLDQERLEKAEAERDALRAAMDACKILDEAVKAGHETTSGLLHHLLSAVEPARQALKGDSDE